MKRKYELYDAFETHKQAINAAEDLRSMGDTAMVKSIPPPANGRLRWDYLLLDEGGDRDVEQTKSRQHITVEHRSGHSLRRGERGGLYYVSKGKRVYVR